VDHSGGQVKTVNHRPRRGLAKLAEGLEGDLDPQSIRREI
jgi:hypothetical protein